MVDGFSRNQHRSDVRGARRQAIQALMRKPHCLSVYVYMPSMRWIAVGVCLAICLTEIVPEWSPGWLGANVTETVCEAPGEMIPDVQFAVNAIGPDNPDTASGPVPLLVIVKLADAVRPTSIFAKDKLPLSTMTRDD